MLHKRYSLTYGKDHVLKTLVSCSYNTVIALDTGRPFPCFGTKHVNVPKHIMLLNLVAAAQVQAVFTQPNMRKGTAL